MSNDTNDTNSINDLTLGETAFYLGAGIGGLLMDTLILVIAFRHINTHDRPHQIFVINMTIADLLFSIICILFRPYLKNLTFHLCVPYYMIICSSQIASCLFLLWLNVDKLIFIQFPLHYDLIVSRLRVQCVTVATWLALISFSFVIYHFFMHYQGETKRCDQVEVQPAFVYLAVCIVYVLGIVISFAISLIILRVAQNSSQSDSSRVRRRLFRRLFFIFSSTLWTFITCLPYRVLYLAFKICSMMTELEEEAYPCFPKFMFVITNLALQFLVIGTVVNPFITIVTQRLYRNRVLRYLIYFRSRFCGRWFNSNVSKPSTTSSTGGVDVRKRSSIANLEQVCLTENANAKKVSEQLAPKSPIATATLILPKM